MPIIISGSNGISGVDGTAAAPAVQGGDNNTGMFFPAADTIAFSEGGTEVLRLNASGNAVFTGTVRVGGIAADLYPLVQGTAVASTSGTAIDFTGLPSWVRRVTVMFNGVSTNGANQLLLQIGTSSGVVATGYVGGAQQVANVPSQTASSTGFIAYQAVSAGNTHSGVMTLANVSANTWVFSATIARQDGVMGLSAGSLALAAVLDRVRITTVGGTDTFDAGTVNILWE